MMFDQLPANSAVFLDANTFAYAIINHPVYEAKCAELLDRIELQDVQGLASSQGGVFWP
jgi:predicted nucleic acid-binding protein